MMFNLTTNEINANLYNTKMPFFTFQISTNWKKKLTIPKVDERTERWKDSPTVGKHS